MGVGDCKSGSFDRICTTTSNIHKDNRNSSSNGGEVKIFGYRNSKPAVKESNRDSSCFTEISNRGILQQSLFSSKTLRRLPDDTKSQKPQQVCESQEVQDGVLKIDNTCTGRGTVGLQNRLAGCLLSHCSEKVSQTIPTVCLQRHSVPISNSSFWLDFSPTCFYKGGHNFDRVLTSEGNSDPCLLGRLAHSQQRSSESDARCGVHSHNLEKTGVSGESQEVYALPVSNSRVPRSNISLQPGVCHDHRRSLDKDSRACHSISEKLNSISPPISGSSGNNGILYRPSTLRKTSYEANSIVFTKQVETRIAQSGKDDPGGKDLEGSPNMVDKEKESVQGTIYTTAVISETDNSHNRRHIVGLGGTPGRSSDRGLMVQGSPEKSHKLARTEGNSAISSPIQRSLDGQNSFGQVRQFNSHSLHQESGGGTRSPDLCFLLWDILRWCDQYKITLKATHIAGKKNTLADALSR